MLWDDGREGGECQSRVEVKAVCPAAQGPALSSSHVAGMDIWSCFRSIRVRSPHKQESHFQKWALARMDPILCSVVSSLFQHGWASEQQMKIAAVSQRMLTKTNHLKPVLLGNTLPLTMHHHYLYASALLIFLLLFFALDPLKNSC